ncbi:hypothetical protein K439DRAFT_1517220 [Ramaria rubella]|nr:hypothetical protein K439DRAFT_1517220 [Ramaria rubella]
MEVAANASSSTISNEPHEMRITDHGKIHSFVTFALKFLQVSEYRPLVLHTFPSTKDKLVPKQGPSTQTQRLILPQEKSDSQTENPCTEEPLKKKRKLATPIATIPRLVSVVEIIKREYGKWAMTRQDANGGPAENSLRTGLHQYNELATLEDLGILEPLEHEPDEAERLREALEGKNFMKLKLTPHLKITLSVSAQPELETKGATHQPPPPVNKSKSAKARERKRMKKKEAAT